jgi:hypothetical protein
VLQPRVYTAVDLAGEAVVVLDGENLGAGTNGMTGMMADLMTGTMTSIIRKDTLVRTIILFGVVPGSSVGSVIGIAWLGAVALW